MPEPLELDQLGLEASSEIGRLLALHPDIESRRYRDGEYLIREGEESQEVFLVLQGAFAVEQALVSPICPPANLACVMCDLDTPAIVGEMAYLGSLRRTASVRVSGSSRVLCLKPSHIDAILQDFPGLTRMICQQFAERLRETNHSLRLLQDRFALKSTPRLAQPGEVLFSEGEPAAALFQLMTGRVRIECQGQTSVLAPDDLFLGFLEPGPFLRNAHHGVTAVVEDSAFLATLGMEFRLPLVRCYPELALKLLEQREKNENRDEQDEQDKKRRLP